jgi:hypothetical protein
MPIGGRTLTLSEALAAQTSAPARPVPVRGSGAPERARVDGAGRGRTKPTRDKDGVILISDARALKPLPVGRYRTPSGVLIEKGESNCAEGMRLRRVKGAERRLAHEKAIQEALI